MSDTVFETPRIEMLSIDEAKRRAADVGLPDVLAPLSVFRILLRRPALAKSISDVLMLLLTRSTLPGELRELVIMRLGWAYRSNYEWTQHWRIATGMGMSDEKVLAVRDWASSELLSDAEKAVLQATDDVIDTGAVKAETWKLCKEHVGDDDVLIDLVAAITNWRSFATLLNSMEVPLEDGVNAWPPDGREPSD